MSIFRNVARLIARHGETMILKRTAEGTTISLKGKIVPGAIDEMDGTSAMQAFHVRIAPTEIAASAWANKAPVRSDRIVVAGRERAILDAKPLGDGGIVALYELTVTG